MSNLDDTSVWAQLSFSCRGGNLIIFGNIQVGFNWDSEILDIYAIFVMTNP